MKMFALLLVSTVMVSGCAKRSDLIDASPVSPAKYASFTCEKLNYEMGALEDQLEEVSAAQDRAARNDNLMVVLIRTPTSAGGIPEEVARLKGEIEAIRIMMREKGCTCLTQGRILGAPSESCQN